MKFYRGLVDVGKAPVRHQIKRGFRPMTMTKDQRYVEVRDAKPANPMSAAEVVVLRHLHGPQCITELKEIGSKPNLAFSVERDRLEMLYGDKKIEEIFGVRGIGTKLPREIEIEDAYMAIEDRVQRAEEPAAEDDDEMVPAADADGEGEQAAA
jgi:hypothetical protein